jgi:hypothetical protein
MISFKWFFIYVYPSIADWLPDPFFNSIYFWNSTKSEIADERKLKLW